jgi:diguanylate cyclase (GGDEF)-like protein
VSQTRIQNPTSSRAARGARPAAAASVPADALQAARQEIDALRKQERILKQRVARLTLAVARAKRFADRDELTGLPNRQLLADRVNQAMALAARHRQRVALLFLDIDEFKYINDSMGHDAGDKLLQQIAARLTACLRSSDTACRYGGDEFVVLLPEFEGRECIMAVAQKIRARLAPPYLIDVTSIEVTVSIGMAVYPTDGDGYGDLLRVSDLAMYQDKAQRRCSSESSRAHVEAG